MKKLLALLLALMMLFSVATVFAGCEDSGKKKSSSSEKDDKDDENEDDEEEKDDETKAGEGEGETDPDGDEPGAAETTAPEESEATEPEITEAEVTEPEVGEYKMVSDFSFITDTVTLMAYEMGDAVYIDMTTPDVVKRGQVDTSVWDTISKYVAVSGYEQLEAFYDGDGMQYAFLTISFADGDYFYSESFSSLHDEFLTVMNTMMQCFEKITADMGDYVAAPMESGEIADSDRAALEGILAHLELPNLADSYAITGVAKDENFGYYMGLSSYDTIASALNFSPMMMTDAYSLNIVTLNKASDANTVALDFENSIDWTKWVCVQPESACIAVKDNQVLCLLGSGDFYGDTVDAIEAAGWTIRENLSNPNF